MKTITLTSQKVTDGMLLIILGASLFFLMSCQKEELATMNQGTNESAVARTRSNQTVNVFTMFVIDHSAGLSTTPDYRLEVQSDGMVTFKGIRNTAFIGEKNFKVSEQTVLNLRDLFIANKFNFIKDDLTQIPDLSMNATTFRSDMHSEAITLLDNTKYPSQLVDLRNTAERIFQVTQLIYKERNIESAPEKMNQEHN